MKTAKTKAASKPPATIREYIATFPRDVRAVLERVRRTISAAVPESEETISYRIAAFKFRGRILIYFAGWKNHYSIYPATAPLISAFKARLGPYEFNNKGTIRFPLSETVPVKLIADIAKFRAKEVVAASAAAKAARQK